MTKIRSSRQCPVIKDTLDRVRRSPVNSKLFSVSFSPSSAAINGEYFRFGGWTSFKQKRCHTKWRVSKTSFQLGQSLKIKIAYWLVLQSYPAVQGWIRYRQIELNDLSYDLSRFELCRSPCSCGFLWILLVGFRVSSFSLYICIQFYVIIIVSGLRLCSALKVSFVSCIWCICNQYWTISVGRSSL